MAYFLRRSSYAFNYAFNFLLNRRKIMPMIMRPDCNNEMSDKSLNIYESELRVISRQTQRANEIFKNIKNGIFP